MDWEHIISRRKNTYVWAEKVPARELIDKIVNEIHEFCPSKQKKVPFYLDVIDNTDYNSDEIAYNLLLKSKDIIGQEAIQFINSQISTEIDVFIDYTYDSQKCLRDVGYVVSAYANDIKYITNNSTIDMARGYWLNGEPQVRRLVEVPVHKHLKQFIVEILIRNKIKEDTIQRVKSLCDIIINVIDNGTETIPEKIEGTRDLRYEIFKGTDRKGNGFASDIRNPQVLAPYIFVFSQRSLNSSEIGLNAEMCDLHKARNVSENEIGLASMFTVLSAASKGLDTGFCACIRNGDVIAKRLGHIGPVLLYVGIGYSSNEKEYFNPIIHKLMDIPNSEYDQKPNIATYYKFTNI
jgi:hypothetical protein